MAAPTVTFPVSGGDVTLEAMQDEINEALEVLYDDAAPSGHGHAIADVTDLQTELNGKSASGHGYAIADVTDLQTELNGKSASGHGHAIADVTDLQTELNGKSASGHGHAIADVTDLQTELNGKSASGHGHAIVDVTDLQTELNGKLSELPFASPDEALGGARGDAVMSPATTRAAINAGMTTAVQRGLFNFTPAMIHSPMNPGIAYLRYSSDVQGPASTMALFTPNDTEVSPRGPVLQLKGDNRVAPRDVITLEAGRKYRVRWEGRRPVDSADPSGDAVEFGIAWLNSSLTQAGLTIQKTVLVDYGNLTTANGWVTADAVISTDAGTGIDAASSEAMFARPYVQQYGSDRSFLDVRILADEDVTDKPVFDEPSAALEERIAVLEGTNLLAATLLPASTDLDGIDTPYEYYGSDLVNGPTYAPTDLGIQVRAVGANRLQTAYSASGSSLDTWRRLRSSGTWGAWVKNASESYVDTMFQSLANSVTTSAVVDHTPAFVDDGTATDFVAAHTSQVFEGVLTGSDASGLWCDFMASVNATITYTTAGTSGVLITLPFATDETNVSGYAINARPTSNFPRHSTDIGMIAGSSTVDGLTRAAIGFERSIDGSTADVRFYALSEIPSGTAIGLVVWGKYKVAT